MSSKPLVIALSLLHHFLDCHDLGDSRRVPSLHAEHFPGRVAMEQKETGIIVRTTDRKAGDAAQPLTVNLEVEPAGECSRFGDYNVCDQFGVFEKLARWFHPEALHA